MDRIIEAAGRVLAETGYDGSSVNQIAAEAGVSSGSFYQYFPNKDAVIVAVLERFSAELTTRIDTQLTATMHLPWRQAGRALLTTQFDVFTDNIGPLRTIIERLPQLGGTSQLDSLHRRVGDLTRLYLIAHRGQFRPDLNIDTAVWVMVETSAQLAIRYVATQPPIPREHLIDEIAGMLIGYLTNRPMSP